jgi:hypothetical protein
MASGFLGVTGPWDLECGLELGADEAVAGVRVDVQGVRLLAPLAAGFVGGNASRPRQGLGHGRQHRGRQRERLPGGHVQRQAGRQTARCVDGEPVADGRAMDAQERGRVWARVGWPAGPEGEPLEAWRLAPLVVPLEAWLQRLRSGSDDRHIVAHGLRPSAWLRSPPRLAGLCTVLKQNSYKPSVGACLRVVERRHFWARGKADTTIAEGFRSPH